jgi:MscS family membrane protein
MKKIALYLFTKTSNFCDRWRGACRLPLVATFLLAAHLLPGQSLSGLLGTKTPAPTSQAPVDPLNRSTPRSAVFNFLEACHSQSYTLAARYLDLRKIPADQRRVQGPELAKQLADILDRDPAFELERLSDAPAGDTSDSLAPDLETLVKLGGSDDSVLFLHRIQQQGMEVWVVSSDSLAHIGELDALEGESEIEKKMPLFFVQHKFLGTSLWVWLGLAVLTLLLLVLSRVLSRLFLAIFAPVLKRFSKSLRNYRLETLTDPLRLLISLAVFRASMEIVTPSALVRDYLLKLLAFLSTLGVAALAMRIIDLGVTQMQIRAGVAERSLSSSVLPLGMRVVRIGIFLIAAVVILTSWGYNTNAILAGLGVGGLAVALAAQKTIENLFGAIALISDHPVLVGDYCQFGTQAGTVEDIGLRSTRIRTNDRTMVTIPNSNFSTMTIENLSRRDRIWFHPTLRLRRDTDPDKVREMMEAADTILREDPMVQVDDVPIRFTKITDYSLELEIFAYVATPNFNEYLKVQSALLLKLLEAGRTHGVDFAIPVAESITINPPEASPTMGSDSHPGAAPPAALPPPG